MIFRLVAVVGLLVCLPTIAGAHADLRRLADFEPRFTPPVVVVGGVTEASKASGKKVKAIRAFPASKSDEAR